MKKFGAILLALFVLSGQSAKSLDFTDPNGVEYEIKPIDGYHRFLDQNIVSNLSISIKNGSENEIKLNSTSPLNGLINLNTDKILKIQDIVSAGVAFIAVFFPTFFINAMLRTFNPDHQNINLDLRTNIHTAIITGSIASILTYFILRGLHGNEEIPENLKPNQKIEYVLKVLRRNMHQIVNRKKIPTLDYQIISENN